MRHPEFWQLLELHAPREVLYRITNTSPLIPHFVGTLRINGMSNSFAAVRAWA
jgi:hypothetical protein